MQILQTALRHHRSLPGRTPKKRRRVYSGQPHCAVGRTEKGTAKKTAVVIVDHGSRRQEANALLYQVVDAFQSNAQIEIVEGAHMEIQKPDIEDALCACVERGAEHVVVSPFFLSPGRHSQEDIPLFVEQAIERQGMQISYSIAEPIGMDPLIVEILQQRVNSALQHNRQR